MFIKHLTAYNSKERALKQNDPSPKGRQKASKIWVRNETKKKHHFFLHVSKSLLSIQFVAVAFQSE